MVARMIQASTSTFSVWLPAQGDTGQIIACGRDAIASRWPMDRAYQASVALHSAMYHFCWKDRSLHIHDLPVESSRAVSKAPSDKRPTWRGQERLASTHHPLPCDQSQIPFHEIKKQVRKYPPGTRQFCRLGSMPHR